MGQITSYFCVKKQDSQVNFDQEFENWKQELFKETSYCDAIMSVTYENPKYYVIGSCFYDKKQGEPIGFKVYIKSQADFPYYLIDDVTEDECSICGEKLQKKNNDKYIELPCGHTFHEKCFKQWAHTKWANGSSPDCPMCRYQPPNDDAEILRIKEKEEERRLESNSYSSYDSS